MEILEVVFLTKNLKETERFYSEKLGLKVKFSAKNEVTFKAGQTDLKFIENKEVDSIYHFAFNIPNNKIEESKELLSKKVELLVNEENEKICYFKDWDAKAIYFYDNNGNILEFIARKDLNNSTSEEFDQNQIENISEIGIPNENPKNFAEELIKEYGLTYFEKDKPSETFIALGKNSGLFIIVKNERNWYPTKSKAKVRYCKVTFKTDQNQKAKTLVINPLTADN
ncbi:MAG: VOC family protein [Chitinophagales bacterium]